MAAFGAALLIAGLASLLRGASPGAIVAAIVASVHALRLRVRRDDTGQYHDGGQRTQRSSKRDSS
jgi:hypothetical protein